jgi:signal peptidase I
VGQKKETTIVDEQAAASGVVKADPPRGFVAEWTVTIILLLFGTTTLVQAFVIPTGSMEDTLLIGDHLLVDKLAYAPPGPVSKYLLPYEDVKRGDIIVFRYPHGHPADVREARAWAFRAIISGW